MIVGVLAVQGDFAEHEMMLDTLGIKYIELRKKEDVSKEYDAIVLPGGESTVQSKLLKDLDMFDTLKNQIKNGMPVLATCAGLILLSSEIEGNETAHIATLPVTVKRNAYGRQLGSFYTEDEVSGIGKVPMTFIRAPYITKCSPEVEIIAKVNDNIVGVRYKNQLAFSFHPELDSDLKIYETFIELIKAQNA